MGWNARVAPSPPFVQRDQLVREVIASELEQSSTPVTLVDLAEAVRIECPRIDDLSWEGHGSFKALVASSGIDDLRFSTVPPGYAYLGKVHEPPSDTNPPRGFSIPEDLRMVLDELRQQTGIPLLDAPSYQAVFEALSDEVQERPFQLTESSKAVRDRMSERNLPIGRTAINFIIKGVHWGGHRYDPDLPQDAKTLATAFVRNLLNLVQPRPPLEGPDLDAALSFCAGELLSPTEIAQVGAGTFPMDGEEPVGETAGFALAGEQAEETTSAMDARQAVAADADTPENDWQR